MAALKRFVAPAVEPVTLDEAKLHLRVDIADDDALISSMIVTAREACEAFIHGFLITQQWEVILDAFPNDLAPILIPIEPLQSVQSVTWLDQANNLTTMNVGTDYLVDADSEPGRLVLPPNIAWPGNSLWPVSPIKINVTAGFGATGSSVPESYKLGMKLCLAAWYENREAIVSTGAVPKEVPMGAEYLWWAGGRYWHLK